MIRVEQLVKEYRGSGGAFAAPVRALAGVDLEIGRGEAVGIVGVNGAGKSTLVRTLLGYARPTSGTVRIDGVEPRSYVERRGVAYVPERVAIPPGWSVRRALHAFAALSDIGPEADVRVEQAIARLGLLPLAERRVDALSKGNLQRLAIAQAILPDRDVMILDEPTDGLDPLWIAELREIIDEWRAAAADRILILASHNLSEVARVVRRVIFIHGGRVRHATEGPIDPLELERVFLSLVRTWTMEEAP